MKKIIVGFGLVAVMALFFVSSASAKLVVRYGHVLPERGHPAGDAANAFKEYVEKKTDGEIKIKIFPMGQLGGGRAMAEQVQAGTLDMSQASLAEISTFVPQMAAYFMPFVFPDSRVAEKMYYESKGLREKFFKLYPQKGFISMGFVACVWRNIINTKRLIRKPEDLRGLKLRVMEAPILVDTFKTLEVNVATLPFPELYQALQLGVIDGIEMDLMTANIMRFTEIVKFCSLINHAVQAQVFIVTPSLWNRLTESQKQVFREASDIQEEVGLRQTRVYNADSIKKAKERGVSISEPLTQAEVEQFRNKVKPVYEKYAPVIGEKLFGEFLERIKELSKK
jgi:tripartite ATP-independent transporter DctP family solute receptor